MSHAEKVEKTTACGWCGEPATLKLADRSYRRLGSGSVVGRGAGTLSDSCGDCAERLIKRYGLREVERAA